jgi:hypothetical protein
MLFEASNENLNISRRIFKNLSKILQIKVNVKKGFMMTFMFFWQFEISENDKHDVYSFMVHFKTMLAWKRL